MARKIVSLYIDDACIRVLVTRGKQIKKWAESALEPGLVKGNVVNNEAEVAAQIKQLLKSQKISAKKVIIGISGLHCLSRPIILPPLPRAMLNEAVMREAKRVLPVPPEQLYISWQTIPAPEGKIQVFLVAIPRETADMLHKTLRRAGLKPYHMDLKPLVLASMVKEATSVVVDVQPGEFDIVIINAGVPQPVRSVPFPSEVLSRQERMLIVKNELDRTIKFHNSNNPEKPLRPDVTVFVSGELADKPELCNSLSDDLGYPVSLLSSPLIWPETSESSHYMVNTGLALKEVMNETSHLLTNLNTLPAPYRSNPVSLVKVAGLPCAAAVIGILVLLTMTLQKTSADITSLQNRIDYTNQLQAQKQIQKKELIANISELEKNLVSTEALCKTFTTALINLDKQGNETNIDLEVTVDSSPISVILTRISRAGGKLTICGSSPSEADVLLYARKLDDTGRFPEVTIATIMRGEGETMEFILILETGGQG